MPTHATPTILHQILRHKTVEVAQRQAVRSLAAVQAAAAIQPPPRPFAATLRERVENGSAAVIAEIKRASPSRGLLCAEFDPVALAQHYASAGAACLSVITETAFFQGDDAHLIAARAACELPVLRKDFIIDAYQIYEARLLGADAILLIVAALTDEQLHDFTQLAFQLDLAVLVEVHDARELHRALAQTPITALLGINNRNLHTFAVTLESTLALLPQILPQRLIVTESGIHTRDDVRLMRAHGVNAFLIGEALVRAPDPAAKLHELFAPLLRPQ